jgi:hypothetical protein
MSDLLDAVRTARNDRLKSKKVEADVSNPSAFLFGECQRNAAVVRDELRSRGVQCCVVGGALHNAYRPDELPPSFEATKRDGFGVHYWVEAEGRVCEIASESELYWGEAIAVHIRPSKLGYKRFEDSYSPRMPF